MTVVSILRLPVRPEAVRELARAFEELDVFGHSEQSGGFLGGRFLRPLEEQAPVVVVAEWESSESYQAWLDNPVRDELRGRLAPLLAGVVAAGDLYEEVPVR
ncbi:MAG TPA: antibiotic biosynthesis monooxygenase family protein [Gaiellaceae bacterium]|nr:antibiotic biosynthesis monooxygenase family protein [Gaiellaceae bacterium]